MTAIAWILGVLALYILSRPRVSLSPRTLGEGYMDSYNIVISPTLLDISTDINEAGVVYPATLDPGFVPVITVPVNFYNADAGTYVFCRIEDTLTGVVLTKQKSSLILFGGSGSKSFTFMGRPPGGDWHAVMPSTAWYLTVRCGISWL